MTLSRRQLALAGLPAPTLLACRSRDALQEPLPALGAVTSPSPSPQSAQKIREVRQVVESQPTTEGAGVRLRRALGGRALSMLDPFLMLDEFRSDNPADYEKGFPSHPHRGFETVTYMLDGAMEHRDSLGNQGRLGAGTVQWMTAGRGIIHSEMPKQERGLMFGFQLWVNLPAAKKMVKPRYQDLAADRIVEMNVQDARVRLVAGELAGKVGPVSEIATTPLMMDVAIARKGRFEHAIPAGHNAFAYVFDGTARFGTSTGLIKAGNLVVLGPGERVAISADDGTRMMLFAGRPLKEPVARYGPFVMNTDEEIRQAMDDYRAGRLVTEG